jgi:cysteine desulfurase
MAEMPQESCKMAGLRNRLRDKIMGRLDETYINGSMEQRLPGNLNISFAYVEGESLLMGINDIAVSSGSACTSATLEPSYVLKALGDGRRSGTQLDPLRRRPFQHRGGSRLRGRSRDREWWKLRELSPLYEMAKEGIDLKSVKWAGEAH